jgi:hypothetical protein
MLPNSGQPILIVLQIGDTSMTPEQRLQVANEINLLWFRHIRCGERPPDLRQVARILEQYEARETAGTAPQKRVTGLFLVH